MLSCKTFFLLLPLMAGCSTEPLDQLASWDRHLAHRDYTVTRTSRDPQLLAVEPTGRCRFRFYQPVEENPDGYFYTSASPGEQIDGGTSDFTAKLLNADFKRQQATIRQYDLGSYH